MIEFTRVLWAIIDRRTQRSLLVVGALMASVSVLEALALILMIPLMELLTAPGFESNAPAALLLERHFPHLSPAQMAAALGVAVVSLYVVKGVSAILLSRRATTVGLREELRVVVQLLTAYLRAPYRVYLEENSASFVRTLNLSTRQVFGAALVPVLGATGEVLSALFVACVLVASSPVPALVTAIYFVLVAFTYQRVLQPRTARAAARVHKDQAEDFRLVRQSLSSVKEIKVRGVEDYFIEQTRHLRGGLLPSYRTLILNQTTPRYVLELAMIGAASVIAVASYTTQPASKATAILVIFLAGGYRILGPLNKVTFALMAARSALPAGRQILTDIERFPERAEAAPAPAPAGRQSLPHGSDVRFDRVNFRYASGRQVLHDVSFVIHPGEAVGLVGASGAGKSTIADLLLGLLSPDSGEILLGGAPAERLTGPMAGVVGYVPQAITLLDDSVVSNVAFGVPPAEVDLGRVWEVLGQAQLLDVVAALPERENTSVGESGVRLSGGQRQRLGLARALYPKPHILVLDEATSALDSETEARLSDILEDLHGEMTMVVIAHRLSTVRRCDRLFFVDEGRIVGSGTFDELAGSTPGFARLVELSGLAAGTSQQPSPA